MTSIAQLLDRAAQIAAFLPEVHLDEVELDGEMVSAYELRDQFLSAAKQLHTASVADHQAAWAEWLRTAFPNDPVVRPKTRVTRFLEEAIELSQALEIPVEKVHELVDFVYAKPIGDVDQELAGSFATLLMVAESQGLDLGRESVKELESAYRRIPQIREKSKLKPKVLQ